jgi:hypothetical protein
VGSEKGHWAHVTPNLNGLSYRFAVRSDDGPLGRQVERLLGGLLERGGDVAERVDHWYSLCTTADGTVEVVRDGELLARAQHPGDAVGWLLWDVNRAAADSAQDHLLFHAAGLCDGAVGMLVPGASGSGKSTLAAGLVRAGFAYLSDELVALEIEGGRLLPYAKPITVKPGSFGALRDMAPSAVGGAGDRGGSGEWLLAVGDEAGRPIGGACPPGLVVVPRYEPGEVTQLTPLSETEAFVALAVNAVNFTEHGAQGTRALGELVARCECVSLTMSDLDQAVDLVRGLMSGVRNRPVPGVEAGAAVAIGT